MLLRLFQLGHWERFSWLLCPLTYFYLCGFKKSFPPHTSLFSGTMRYSRLILCIFCFCHRLRHFSKEPCFLLLEMLLKIKIWILEVVVATGVQWGVILPSCVIDEVKHLCVCLIVICISCLSCRELIWFLLLHLRQKWKSLRCFLKILNGC